MFRLNRVLIVFEGFSRLFKAFHNLFCGVCVCALLFWLSSGCAVVEWFEKCCDKWCFNGF